MEELFLKKNKEKKQEYAYYKKIIFFSFFSYLLTWMSFGDEEVVDEEDNGDDDDDDDDEVEFSWANALGETTPAFYINTGGFFFKKKLNNNNIIKCDFFCILWYFTWTLSKQVLHNRDTSLLPAIFTLATTRATWHNFFF